MPPPCPPSLIVPLASPREPSLMRTLLLALLAALGACASNPWVCTSESCTTIATADLPPDVAGTWRAADGSELRIAFFQAGVDGPAVRTTATVMGTHPAGGSWGSNHVRTFDGAVAVTEERLGADPDAPVRFFRLTVAGDRLTLADVSNRALVSHAPAGAGLRVVETPAGQGLVYDDLEGMAAGLQAALAEPLAWGEDRVYRRAD